MSALSPADDVPPRAHPVEDEGEAAASALCVACGICCEGVLHRKATLDPEDVEPSRQLGLRLAEGAEPAALHLPCPKFDGCCTVYAGRPRVCRRYACKLLQQATRGEIAHQAARDRIATARERVAEVRFLLPPDEEGVGLWRQIEALAGAAGMSPESEEFRHDQAELVLNLTLLGHWLDLYFRPDPEELAR